MQRQRSRSCRAAPCPAPATKRIVPWWPTTTHSTGPAAPSPVLRPGTGAAGAAGPDGRPAWRRFLPLAVLLAGLAAFFALGLDRYVSFRTLSENPRSPGHLRDRACSGGLDDLSCRLCRGDRPLDPGRGRADRHRRLPVRHPVGRRPRDRRGDRSGRPRCSWPPGPPSATCCGARPVRGCSGWRSGSGAMPRAIS